MPDTNIPSSSLAASAAMSTPPPTQSPRDRKLAALNLSNAQLQQQLSGLECQREVVRGKLKSPPEETVKRHIQLLHEYNEVKDVAMGLMGLVAESRGVAIKDVAEECGVGEDRQ